MLDYFATVTCICQHCMEVHDMDDSSTVGTTYDTYVPCAICGEDGQNRRIVLLFNTEGIMPGNEMLHAHFEGK